LGKIRFAGEKEVKGKNRTKSASKKGGTQTENQGGEEDGNEGSLKTKKGITLWLEKGVQGLIAR